MKHKPPKTPPKAGSHSKAQRPIPANLARRDAVERDKGGKHGS